MCLLYKFKRAFPHPEYTLPKSYLKGRTFHLRYQEEYTKLCTIQSGVQQDSILGPIHYSIFTADLPKTEQTLTATNADDIVILASHQNPITASRKLQNHLNQFKKWLKRWRIKANENKSTHVTFTLKRENCPTVTLNGNKILQGETAKYLCYFSRQKTVLVNSHICQKKTAGAEIPTNVLDARNKIGAFNKK